MHNSNSLDCSVPWIENPYRLVSLEVLMKVFNGRYFLALYRSLLHIESIAEQSPDANIQDELRESLAKTTKEIEDECRKLGLPTSALRANVARMELEEEDDLKAADIAKSFGNLSELIVLEMETHLFMYIEPTKVAFYSEPDLFGELVGTQFPSSRPDIEEAGKCLALNRATACVFHLMRVLEAGIGALAIDLKVTWPISNWYDAINQIEKAIRGLPQKDERKQPYSDAAAYLMLVKDAWRNEVAHAGRMYSEEQAHQIFTNVKGFMQNLASRLVEQKQPASQSEINSNEQ